MSSRLGILQILLAGACFGFLGIFGKLAFAVGISIGELLTFRFLLASAILFLSLLTFKPNFLSISIRQLLISLGLGFFGYAVFATLYFEAIRGISVGLAALLLFTFPIFVNLGSWLIFKEPISRQQLISLVLAMIGIILLIGVDWSIQNHIAIFYALGAAISYSAYVLISGKLQAQIQPLTSSLYVMIGATIGLYFFHRPSTQILFSDENAKAVLIFIGIAVICTIIPLTLFLAGLQKMTSSRASLLVTVEPLVATLAGVLIFNENLSGWQVLGAFCLFLALMGPGFLKSATKVALQ